MEYPIPDPDPFAMDPYLGQLGPDPGAPMTEVMAPLQFDPGAIPTPWDAQGHITALDPVVGTPQTDAACWQLQTTPFTCAVMAQRGIIEAFTGRSVSEAQLVYDATVNGWLTDGGMSPADAGNLLTLYGIPCHEQTGATIEDLMTELSQGHKVIVGVDSGELWNQDASYEDFFKQAADHAIWVTGIDMTDPDHPKVIINDSGTPDGAGKAYDLSVFADAWQDSGFFYVSTDNAPPDIQQIASGFDPATGAFPDMVTYFSGAHGGLGDRVQDDGPQAQTDAVHTASLSNTEDDRLGAGTCYHCGGSGYTTWPSSGSQEACWYCGGSGIAS